RRAKIVVSDDEESSEDPSKQGRMIEDIDQDVGISLVNLTKVSSQEDQSKDRLGVLSAAKVLTDAAKKNINTYTRKRRAVSTGNEGVSTASRIFSTAEESVSIVGASMPLSTAGMVQQVNIVIPSLSETTETIKNKEQEELLASETTEDEANPPVADIDWDDVTSFVPMDSIMEKERTKRAGLNLKEESLKRQKTGEGSKPTKELKADEILQEDLQQMIMVVPVEEVYVEALQVKYPIID
ncbi:hypothetical protein Tco_1322769, partial [Tanacetum coccineum]